MRWLAFVPCLSLSCIVDDPLYLGPARGGSETTAVVSPETVGATDQDDLTTATDSSMTEEAPTGEGSTGASTTTGDASTSSSSTGDPTGSSETGSLLSHTIFVTSTVYEGDLGGLAGADATCQMHADSAGLPGTWMAVLSDSSTAAVRRIVIEGEVGNVQSELVASDGNSLWTGMLVAAVQYDEFGQPTSGNAWTGSVVGGTGEGSHCNDWTAAQGGGYFGHFGDPTAMDAAWIDGGGQQCGTTARLYCIN